MTKEEFIKRYGEEAYNTQQEQTKGWHKQNRKRTQEINRVWEARNPDKTFEIGRQWRATNPEKVEQGREESRKGGKYYEQQKQYKMTGLQHEKTLIRQKHQRIWNLYKQIIAPNTNLHHEWIPNSAGYRGLALVDKEEHQHGIINPIAILEGKITLLTEEEIRGAI